MCWPWCVGGTVGFQRPWLVENPGEIGILVDLLGCVGRERGLRLAMEPTGSYGDVLRQALSDAGLALERVEAKAAHDYAEIFDGVPSQHDGKDAGVVAACVLWVYLGDPSSYHCAEAYRKAMGLNLKERSSGIYQGKLKITKRGFGQVRRWLYFAALRLIREGPVGRWYQRKKARDGDKAKRAVIGVMRKLALALHAVGAEGEEFSTGRLFPSCRLAGRRGGCEQAVRRR